MTASVDDRRRRPQALRRRRAAPRSPRCSPSPTRGGPSVKLADFGSCGRRAADGSGLYVTTVAGKRASGQAGWVFAVGGKLGTAGAADPSGPFGSGPLRRGQQVVWFWCKQASACEKSLPR